MLCEALHGKNTASKASRALAGCLGWTASEAEGSAFFSAHTHLCALLVAMTGSHSRRWEAHNYSHTKRGFKMVKDSKGKFLIPADFIVKSAFSIAEIRYEVSTSTHSLAMVLACPLVPGP